MKQVLKLVGIILLVVGLSSGLYSNGLNLNGNGSKAVAMGGAFIGLADDYSAVYWNPAGLTQMKEASLSIFITDIIPKGTYQMDLFGIDTETKSHHYISGSVGYFKPINEKLVVGIYGYVPSGLGAEWDGMDLAALSGGTAYNWKSFFGIITISPVIAYKVSDTLSLGATFNINYGFLKLDRPALGQYSEDINGLAFGATLGMLYKPSDKFSFGLTYKLPIKATLKGDAEMSGAALLGLPTTDDAERETTFPMALGAGIAIKPTDKLTFTMDAQWTNWEKLQTIPITFSNAGWKTFFETDSAMILHWENKIQLRFGMEYKVNETFALRAGYYNDPGPSPVETMNILLPEISYNWFTVGFGYSTAKMNFDFCLEYGKGKDVEVGLMEAGEHGMPGIHGLDMIVPNVAITFKF
jgi:long-chain fatty acid transport protein